MDDAARCLLDALKCALHGEKLNAPEAYTGEFCMHLMRLAQQHNVLPLLAEAAHDTFGLSSAPNMQTALKSRAKQETLAQACRTGDFLLLYEYLAERGLYPAVMKGIVCRSLYPVPEQRASVDEDFLIEPERAEECCRALQDYGFEQANPVEDIYSNSEISFVHKDSGLYIELHKTPFLEDSEAYGHCNELFGGMFDRTVYMPIDGANIRTLSPTDHILYIICHAYKHFLHGGFGIRQVCDAGMMAAHFASEADWEHILQSCRSIRTDKFAAAVFIIAEKYLGLSLPPVFASYDVNELPLLDDIMAGGIYGTADINRMHSSTLTLGAVSAHNKGKKVRTPLRAAFPPLSSMTQKYGFLRRMPVLLPAAWAHRIFRYAFGRKNTNAAPSQSLRIAQQRIQLLREYGIIDE